MDFAPQMKGPSPDLNSDRSLIRLFWIAAIMLTFDGGLQTINHLLASTVLLWRAVGSAGLMVAGLVSLYLLRRQRNTLAFRVMVWSVWSIISLITLVGDGIRSPNMMIFPLLIFCGSWLLSFRTGLLITLLSLLVAMASVAGELAGWLPRQHSPPMSVQATTVVVVLIGVAMVTYYTLASYSRHYEDVRELGDALRASQARLNYVLSVEGQTVWGWNLATDRVRHEHDWCRMMGVDKSYIDQPMAQFIGMIHEDDRELVGASLTSCLDGDGPYRSEHRMHRADGSLVWVAAHGDVFERDEQGKPLQMLGGVSDITKRKRLEQELLATKAAAEKANQAKSHFLAAASHDLRQPLLAISLYVGLLKNRATAEISELVAKTQDCVDSLSAMLTNLLDVSKLEAGVVKPKLSDFAVDDLLGALVAMHSAELELKGLELRIRYSGSATHTDQQLMARILGNLLANAIRYTERGGILVAFRQHGGKQWIEVWDTGVGIPEDKTDIIFEEFRQLGDGARNRGSGLGLAIVAKTAALLGLEIRLRSRPGRGSMFAVELPPGRMLEAQGAPATLSAARNLRIGLVEDNPMVLQAIVLALQSAGHEVIAARNCGELLQGLGQCAPDIVISDYRLAAEETGYDVIAAVRGAFGGDIPAIVVTGDTDPVLIRGMASRGIAVHYKPLQIDALQAYICEATSKRPAPKRTPLAA